MLKQRLMVLSGLFVALCAGLASAEVKLPAIIGSNMVLQANKPVPIWGWADVGEKVTVTFGGQTQDAVTDADGKWKVTLQPLQVGEPQKMTVAGKNTLTLDNVLVGSVWVCGGQSNMGFGLGGAHNAQVEIPKANYPKIRLFTVHWTASIKPLPDCSGKWVECTPQTAQNFIAVGYFFGRDIHLMEKIPVGLISSNWGGTTAQAWASLSGLEQDKVLAHYVQDENKRIANNTPAAVAQYKKDKADYDAQLKAWNTEVGDAYKAELAKWNAAAAKGQANGQPKPEPARPMPKAPVSPTGSEGAPSELFNGMINPLLPFAIEGVIWYQGESNVGGAPEYRTLFPRLITDWREKWGQGDFPFLFVQLENINARLPDPSPSTWGWAALREAQLRTLAVAKTGMAVIIDIGEGDNIHPKDKSDVGHRLALAAEKVAFGRDVVYSGPIYKEMKIEANQIRLSFSSVGSGLVIGSAPPIRLDTPQAPPADHLIGFTICGADKKFVWADARIEGDTVVVSSPKVANPVAVRYAWADNPECNLYNKDGLPASPFRTDVY